MKLASSPAPLRQTLRGLAFLVGTFAITVIAVGWMAHANRPKPAEFVPPVTPVNLTAQDASGDSTDTGDDASENSSQTDPDDNASASPDDSAPDTTDAPDSTQKTGDGKKKKDGFTARLDAFVERVDTRFGEWVVTPLDSVVYFDLSKLYGGNKPVPAENVWQGDTRDQNLAQIEAGLAAYKRNYGVNRDPNSNEEFTNNVIDANSVFFKPAGYTYFYDPDSKQLMVVGPKIPFIVIWLFIGAIFFTLRMGFINFRAFKHSLRLTKGDYDDPNDPGEITHFQALSSALSATVGLGNIAGVAIAIGAGGPGATFWMILVGLLGMSMKFSECTLGQLYRKIDEDGVVSGGPMHYLRDGLAELRLKPLGIALSILFILLCIGASFGGGNMFQVRQSLDAIKGEITFLEDYSFVYGLVMAVAVGLVIVGGIKSIGQVASRVVPFMCGAYVVAAIYILLANFTQIPWAFWQIFSQAFSPEAMYGGFLGVLILGVKRAVFSNEAGAGSAAIAHSAAKTDEPVSEGIVALLEPFIDTVVVCTMTALVVIISGVFNDPQHADIVIREEGAALTAQAFMTGGHEWFKWILYASVVLFAFSTMISWSYYGERCWSDLFGARTAIVYKVIFLAFVILGSIIKPTNVGNFSDMLILGMAFPNLLGGVILSGRVKAALDEYWGRYKSGDIKPHDSN